MTRMRAKISAARYARNRSVSNPHWSNMKGSISILDHTFATTTTRAEKAFAKNRISFSTREFISTVNLSRVHLKDVASRFDSVQFYRSMSESTAMLRLTCYTKTWVRTELYGQTIYRIRMKFNPRMITPQVKTTRRDSIRNSRTLFLAVSPKTVRRLKLNRKCQTSRRVCLFTYAVLSVRCRTNRNQHCCSTVVFT